MKISIKKLAAKVIGGVVAISVFLAVYYVLYLYCGYQRIADRLKIEVAPVNEAVIEADSVISVMTYNIGFGAYSKDYSFFLDGGEYARAFSKEAVNQNIEGAIEVIKACSPDVAVIQEVDVKGTRSYDVNQCEMISASFAEYDSAFAVNYDSPYYFYPFKEPIGKNKSGILTLSRYKIESAVRVSLPVEKGIEKYLDLDRCYSASQIPVDNGKKLVLYNVHLSAYTKDGTLSDSQLELLVKDMAAEYEKGNYAVALGDFNKDLLIDSSEYFIRADGEYNWAKPLNTALLPKEIYVCTDTETPSCRNADKAYEGDGSDFVITVDGALATENVELVSCKTIDTGFEFSDHNPVFFKFSLR